MEYFIEDILNQLIEEALELKGNATDDFQKGKLFGYYETIQRILNQAEAFGISNKLPLKLQDFNLEDLINDIE